MWFRSLTCVGLRGPRLAAAGPAAAQEPDRIFDKSTVWRPLTPNDKLVVYGIDDPAVSRGRLLVHPAGEGRHQGYARPGRGRVGHLAGLPPDRAGAFKGKLSQGEVVFSERRSLIFKSMQIVRGCDAQRNTLIYMVYSDRVIQGSPKNSTSAVPIAPWGTEPAPKMRAMSMK